MRRKRSWLGALALAVALTGCGGDAATTTTASTGNGGPVLPNLSGLSDECASLANLMAGIVQVFGGSTANVAQLFAATEAGLPSDVLADVEIVKDVTEEFIAATGGNGVDLSDLANMSPEELAQFEQAMSILDQDEVNLAFDRISAYAEQACAAFVPTP